MQLEFTVPTPCDGWPLRGFLRSVGVSAALQRAVKSATGFWVGGAPVRTCDAVHAGQTVTFQLPPEPPTTVQPQALPCQVCYESPHALVLDKPAGMAVHPTLGYRQGTLANAYMGLLQARGESGVFRPVNRLDVNTSGLVLCAKNAYAAPLLAAGATKTYWAVAQGEMPLGPGQVDAPIARAPGSIILRCVAPGGQPSCTAYRVCAAAGGVSLVQVTPLTGRTHQIRVHFSHMGYPLAGDELYGGSRGAIGRHALHCAQLTFAPPQGGAPVTVYSPLPPDMAALCRRAGLRLPPEALDCF